MSRVLFLSLVFPPDAVSTAQIIGTLSDDLRALGHEVVVITTTPHYNRDPEAEALRPLRPHWGRLVLASTHNGVPAYHIRMPRKGSSVVLRGLSWLLFHALSTVVALTVPRPDVVIAPSPPLTIGVSAWLIGLLRRCPYIYNVQEIYPDAAIALGALHDPLLIRIFYALERFVYHRAARVTVIAPHMRERLIRKGTPASKLAVIPNFIDGDELAPMPKDNPFRREHGVADKFVVSYAGNMGPAQQLETFLAAAQVLKDEPGIRFMLMGDGILRERLRAIVLEEKLDNVIFLPYQPYSLMPQIYAASDLSLVPQAEGISDIAVPSKVYRIMACARPVLAVAIEDSDLGDLLRTSGAGLLVAPGQPDDLADTILAASRAPEKLRQMGQAGRKHVMAQYTRRAVARQYDAVLREVIG